MLIESHDGAIQLTAPAKLNLFLEVVGKRGDGYHEIVSLMCLISLCDILEFRTTESSELRLRVDLPVQTAETSPVSVLAEKQPAEKWSAVRDPAWDIPLDEGNLVYRAVQRVRECLRIEQGCYVRLKKAIPAAAGLGGGSSDAAAAVVAAMVAWGGWNRLLASQICAELGSDLNVFLGDENRIGLTLVRGRGEQCETLSITPPLKFIVTHPPVGCSTSAVYANWRMTGRARTPNAIVEACGSGDVELIGPQLYNALAASASAITPWIDNQLSSFLRLQLRYNAMTGSGSSCFALASGNESMANIARVFNNAGLSRVYAVSSWFQPSIEAQIEHLSLT